MEMILDHIQKIIKRKGSNERSNDILNNRNKEINFFRIRQWNDTIEEDVKQTQWRP